MDMQIQLTVRFPQPDVGNPASRGHKSFRGLDLLGLITNGKPNQYVRIKRAHAACGCISELPASRPVAFPPGGFLREREPDARSRSNIARLSWPRSGCLARPIRAP